MFPAHHLGCIAQLVRAFASHARGQGFESLYIHQKAVAQTDDITGLSSRFRRPSLLADGEGLDVAVEEHLERDAGFAVDGVVIGDDELVEEGLVGDPA